MDDATIKLPAQAPQQKKMDETANDSTLSSKGRNDNGNSRDPKEPAKPKVTKAGTFHAASIAIGVFGSSVGGALIGSGVSAPTGPSWPFCLGITLVAAGSIFSVFAIHFSQKNSYSHDQRLLTTLAALQDSINTLTDQSSTHNIELTRMGHSLERLGKLPERERPTEDAPTKSGDPHAGLRGWELLKAEAKRVCSR